MANKLIKSSLLFVFFVITVLLLIRPALVNGYPLVYSDSATYIFSGYSMFVPVDRPLMYGLFIYLFGKVISSLWVIIILQAMTVIGVTYVFMSFFSPRAKAGLFTFIALIVISLVTGLPTIVSIILPDIFTPVMLLSISILLLNQNLRLFAKILLFVLVIFSTITHFSNLIVANVLLILFILAFIFIPKRRKRIYFKNLLLTALCVLSCWFIMPLVHYVHGRQGSHKKEFVISRAPNVFIMARFMESGVLKTYLDDKCPDSKIPLCNYKDTFQTYAFQFLWGEGSPLYEGCTRQPWDECWVEKNSEYAPIVREIYTTPKYLRMFLEDSFKNSLQQLISFRPEDIIPLRENSGVQPQIQDHYQSELNEYVSSQQYDHTLSYNNLAFIQNIAVALSAFIIVFSLFFKSIRKALNPPLIGMLIIIFTGLILNAFVCATFSGVVHRYQGRVVWLIPLMMMGMLFRYISLRQELKQKSTQS